MGSTAAEGSGQGLDQRYASQAIADEDDQEADNFAICKLRSCVRLVKTGAVDYLQKPFDIGALVELLRRVTSERHFLAAARYAFSRRNQRTAHRRPGRN